MLLRKLNFLCKLKPLNALNYRNPNPEPKDLCLDGLVILQADRDTSAKVLNRVLKTAYAAEFQNIMFAVNRKESRGE